MEGKKVYYKTYVIANSGLSYSEDVADAYTSIDPTALKQIIYWLAFSGMDWKVERLNDTSMYYICAIK